LTAEPVGAQMGSMRIVLGKKKLVELSAREFTAYRR
jgi:hypothetical protein